MGDCWGQAVSVSGYWKFAPRHKEEKKMQLALPSLGLREEGEAHYATKEPAVKY